VKSELEIEPEFPARFDLSQLRQATGVSSTQLQQLSPAALAYLGDAVYELYVRTRLLLPPKSVRSYHQQVVAQVRAEAQAQHLQLLQPHLTDAEREVLRQGRNGALGGPKRLNPAIYQQATSFETLLGYLYLTDLRRLHELCQYLVFGVFEGDGHS
jgi:ribonuclease III family protein